MSTSKSLPRFEAEETKKMLHNCKRLPSLNSINTALRELLNADYSSAVQIADIVRRDPSLTARLLRLVNSAYYGLSSSVNSIEEAVFFLGVRQIRQLVMMTPVIEDFQKMTGGTPYQWKEFWQYCISVAMTTQEIVGAVMTPPNDESDYLAGLLHDVGKIAIAATFPQHFLEIHDRASKEGEDVMAMEKDYFGMNHAEIGAVYLSVHNLPDLMVEVARYHHSPQSAPAFPEITAAVGLSNIAVRCAGIGFSGDPEPASKEAWKADPLWDRLFVGRPESEVREGQTRVAEMLEKLPSMLRELV